MSIPDSIVVGEPKLTTLQKATIGGELTLLTAILGVGEVGCPECSPLIFTTAEGLYGALLPLLLDPPDPNYMVLSTPSAPPVLIPPDISGLTEQQTEAWADLVENLALWSTLPGAMLDSIQRAEGAFEAGDALWVGSQMGNFDKYYQQDLTYAAAVNTDAVTLGLVSGSTGSAVPEPSTWAMMLIGFAGIAFAGYRRAKAGDATLSRA